MSSKKEREITTTQSPPSLATLKNHTCTHLPTQKRGQRRYTKNKSGSNSFGGGMTTVTHLTYFPLFTGEALAHTKDSKLKEKNLFFRRKPSGVNGGHKKIIIKRRGRSVVYSVPSISLFFILFFHGPRRGVLNSVPALHSKYQAGRSTLPSIRDRSALEPNRQRQRQPMHAALNFNT